MRSSHTALCFLWLRKEFNLARGRTRTATVADPDSGGAISAQPPPGCLITKNKSLWSHELTDVVGRSLAQPGWGIVGLLQV